jgi:hypothetical protein
MRGRERIDECIQVNQRRGGFIAKRISDAAWEKITVPAVERQGTTSFRLQPAVTA